MKTFRRGLGLAIILFIWVIALFFATAWIVHLKIVPVKWAGILEDGAVLLGVLGFNRLFGHVPIQWWSGKKLGRQLRTTLPALVLVGLLVAANLSKLLKLLFWRLTSHQQFPHLTELCAPTNFICHANGNAIRRHLRSNT